MISRKRSIFVVPGDNPAQIQGSPHLERLRPYGEVIVYTDSPVSLEEKIERARHAEVLINTRGAVTWPGEALRALPELRMITTCSIGTNMIDLNTAAELGIVVSNQPGRTAKLVAEHAIALTLAVAKRLAFQTAELKAGRWTIMENVFLHGKTLGVIGTGNIGREVARLAKALGMQVTAWTFHPSAARATDLDVQFVELDDLLRQSDVVSLHVRLSDESRRMIAQRELSLMKKGALLVNVSRGDLIDTAALAAALNSGGLGGAGLDVYDMEPLPPDHPLLSCQQVVLTPHLADMTPECRELLSEGAVDNVIAFLEGHPQNVVTP